MLFLEAHYFACVEAETVASITLCLIHHCSFNGLDISNNNRTHVAYINEVPELAN